MLGQDGAGAQWQECGATENVPYKWTSILARMLRTGGYLRERGQVISDALTGHVKWHLSFMKLQEDPGLGKPLNQFVSPAFAVPPLDGMRLYSFAERYQTAQASGFAPGSDQKIPFCVVVCTPPDTVAELAWSLKSSDEY